MESADASSSTPQHGQENVIPDSSQTPPNDQTTESLTENHKPSTLRSRSTLQPPVRLVDEIALRDKGEVGDSAYIDTTDTGESVDDDLDIQKRNRTRPKKPKPALTTQEPPNMLAEQASNAAKIKVESLKSDYAKLCMEHRELKNVKADYVKKYEKERKLKVEKGREVKVLKAEKAEQAAAYEKQRTNSSTQFAELEQSLREAQASISKLNKKTAEDAMPDDVVCAKFEAVDSMWRPWAKKWSVTSPESLDTAPMRRIIMLGSIDKSTEALGRVVQKFAFKKSLPSILLDTALAHEIHDKIIRKPFFASDMVFEHKGLTEMFDHFLGLVQGDQAKAHRWRAQTLELFDIRSLTASPGSQTEKRKGMGVRLDRLYESLASTFLRGDAAIVLKSVNREETGERLDELLDIFRQVGNLTLELSKQKTQMDSESGILYNIPFDASSKIHRAQASMLVDEDNHEYDGKLPEFVVHPPIMAWGNARGENYGDFKSWLPPVVLIFSDREEKTQAANKQCLQKDAEIKKESEEREKGTFAAGAETGVEDPRPVKKQKTGTQNSTSSSLEQQSQRFAIPKRPNRRMAPEDKTLGGKDRAEANTVSPEDAPVSSTIKQELTRSSMTSFAPADLQCENKSKSFEPPTPATAPQRSTGPTKSQYCQQRLQPQRNLSNKRGFSSIVNEAGKAELTVDKNLREKREKKEQKESAAREAEKAARQQARLDAHGNSEQHIKGLGAGKKKLFVDLTADNMSNSRT